MRRAVFKNNLEGTSYSFFALYLDNAAHHIDDIFGDYHSKSRSLYTVCDGIFLTAEWFKDMLQILFFHSNSIICDHKTIFGIDKHVNFSDLFGKIKRLNVHPVFAALYLAHIKHIIDKTQKVVAGSLDLLV